MSYLLRLLYLSNLNAPPPHLGPRMPIPGTQPPRFGAPFEDKFLSLPQGDRILGVLELVPHREVPLPMEGVGRGALPHSITEFNVVMLNMN